MVLLLPPVFHPSCWRPKSFHSSLLGWCGAVIIHLAQLASFSVTMGTMAYLLWISPALTQHVGNFLKWLQTKWSVFLPSTLWFEYKVAALCQNVTDLWKIHCICVCLWILRHTIKPQAICYHEHTSPYLLFPFVLSYHILYYHNICPNEWIPIKIIINNIIIIINTVYIFSKHVRTLDLAVCLSLWNMHHSRAGCTNLSIDNIDTESASRLDQLKCYWINGSFPLKQKCVQLCANVVL